MKWLKNNWTLLLIFVLVGYLFWSYFDNRKLEEEYIQLNGIFEKQNADFKAYEKEALKEKLELLRQREEAEEKRKEIKKEIKKLETDKVVLARQRDDYKKKMESAKPNVIVIEIGKRIGEEEIRFTLSGTFDMTRVGANNTLFKFIDGETSEANYQNQLKITAKKDEDIETYKGDAESFKKDLVISGTELKEAKLTLADCINAKDSLDKVFKKAKLTQFLKGAGAGVLVALGLKIIFGGK